MPYFKIFKTIINIVIPNLMYLKHSRFRHCKCCDRFSLYLCLGDNDEYNFCVLCRANLRYEMISDFLRSNYPNLELLTVLELDNRSPLKKMLSTCGKYIRTYYSDTDILGTLRSDGSRCEDITRLTLPDSSVDVIISSDVLEHVPDIIRAFEESARVLKTHGVHLFTVPVYVDKTFQRANIINGNSVLYAEKIFHSDPLSPDGIMVYWDFGFDLGVRFSTMMHTISIAAGPTGRDGRILWKLQKVA